jgi:hypothetical protein
MSVKKENKKCYGGERGLVMFYKLERLNVANHGVKIGKA